MLDRHVPQTPSRGALLQGVDYAWVVALMAVGLVLRLRYFSGFGLDDDILFRHSIAAVLQSHRVSGDNLSYRFAWLFPTVLSCQIFGLTETGMIFPIIVTATLGIAVVFALGKALWGRPGALIAALLLVVQPLDFAWSTMLTNDVILSFFSALAILCALRALQADAPAWKARMWILAGVNLWLAYQAKVSGIVIAPVILFIAWTNRHRLDTQFLDFIWTAIVLFGVTFLAYDLYTGDPLAPYHAEFVGHPMNAQWFWTYPRMLFYPDLLGDFLYSLYPHLLLILVLSSRFLRIKTSREAFWWMFFVFLGMELAVRRVDGAWFTPFRNIRHGHVFVYPLVLLLTGYLVTLRTGWPKLCHGMLAAVLTFGTWQSIAVASKTHVTFADMRNACHFLAALPQEVIYADARLSIWCTILDVPADWKFKDVSDPAGRRARLADIESGYLVTGGGREPYYGCWDCIVRAAEVPPDRWRLLREFPGSTFTPWRPEPLRVWEARESPGEASGD